MIDRLLAWSIRYRYGVAAMAGVLAVAGVYAALDLPIDAVPDVTTNQVQINTKAPSFTPLEMEQYITFPIEVAMSNLPQKEEVRSISQFGLSQVTVIFDDGVDIYRARQLVLERLLEAQQQLPDGVIPELCAGEHGAGRDCAVHFESEQGCATGLQPDGASHTDGLVHQAAVAHGARRDRGEQLRGRRAAV